MAKTYVTPFNWDYVDDKSLIYNKATTEEEIREMIGQALDEALDDAISESVDGAVDEAINNMDIRLDGEDLLYKLIVNGNENGEINIPKDQFLKSTSYDSENKKLVFVMETADGEVTTEVSMSDLVSSIESGVGEIQGEITQINEKNEAQDTAIATKADASALDNLATKEEVQAVDAKVDAIVIPDVTELATKEELENAIEPLAVKAEVTEEINSAVDGLNAAIADKADKTELETLATKAEVEAVDAKVEALEIPSIEGLAKSADVTAEIAAAVENKADKSELETLATKAEVQAVDAKVEALEIPSIEGLAVATEVTAEIAAAIADKADVSALDNLATKEEVQTVDAKVDALEIPSIEGLAKSADVTTEIAAAVEPLATKEEIADYVPVEDYNALAQKVAALENYVNIFIKDREEKMDEIINNMDADNKEVVIETPMESIVVPETTVAYTITAPLADNSTVELTSPKYMTLFNTSEEPVSTTISHEYAEGETTSATSVYLVGDFDTLTLENISPSVKSGYDAASVKNVVISENNVKNLSLALDFQDGATITNNSDKDITITDKSNSAIALTIVAPNSAVTLSNGQFTTLNAEVSDNTLIIKKNVHIDNLNLAKGNAIVEVARAEEVAGIVENYTVADGYTLSHRVYHITNENSGKLGGVGEMILDEDITRTASIVAPLAPAYDAVWNLNGHNITVEGTPKSGVYLNRYSSNLEVKGNGVIHCEGSYGLWNNGTTGKIIINDGVTIEAQTHAVYAEKGVIEINGGTFKLTNWADADKDENGNLKFLINCYDANYNNGSANIIVKGGKFYDFNPAVSYGEPNGPVSFVAEGYESVMTTETIDGVEHKVYEVKPING